VYTVIVTGSFTAVEAPSATLTVKLADPAALGFPLNVPPVLSVRPAGSVPEKTDQV
jgi:hypothetical protein